MVKGCSGVRGASCGVIGLARGGARRAGAITLPPVTLGTVVCAVGVPVMIGATIIPWTSVVDLAPVALETLFHWVSEGTLTTGTLGLGGGYGFLGSWASDGGGGGAAAGPVGIASLRVVH